MQSVHFLKRFLLCAIFLSPFILKSQTIDFSAKDSVHVQSLLDLAYDLEIDDPDSAIQIYTTAAEIAAEIDYKMGMGRAIQYTGIVHSDQGKYDKSIALYQRAIEIFEEIPYPVGIAATYNNIGTIYKRKAEYSKAFESYLSAVRVFEESGDTARLIYAYGNVGAILYDVEQYDKSIEFNRIALRLSLMQQDSISMCDELINIGMIKMKQEDLDSASYFFDNTLKIAEKIKEEQSLYLVYNNYSSIASIRNMAKQALNYAIKSIEYAKILNNPAYLSNAYTQCGANFILLDQLDSAEVYLDLGREIAEANQANEVLIRNFSMMSLLKEKQGNIPASLSWMKRFQEMDKQRFGERQIRVVAGLEIEYESEKKDLELSEKALEIERNEALLSKRNYLIIILLGAILSLFVLFFLIRRGLHQKKLIAEKEAQLQIERVEKLKKKQKLIALESMIQGEEKERSRLAKDLHDGLGGMLSSTKMHFSSVAEENEKIKHSSAYIKAIELLDSTSIEARKISHNLMPSALEKFGLIEALKGFCESIGTSDTLEVSFQAYGFDQRLDANTEIMIYRIVMELVNNVLKHAEATELLVQCMRNENQVSITVEDNGSGFELDNKEKEGIGLLNIRSRVDYLNGSLDIDSSIGNGSSISLEFQV